ncbi:MAG TPA: VWA domain-containing protein [Thermoanaerobaculia bacterium]|nr:VWA domain-containing protein [Thermoanaerobaculia bacterium]
MPEAEAQPPEVEPRSPPPGAMVFSEEVAVQWVTVPVTLEKGTAGADLGDNDPAAPPFALGDFELRVDGRPVSVESFDHGAGPFGLVFAQDLSGSMAHGDKLRLSRNALALLLARTGELDEVAILTFAGPAVQVQVPFSSELAPLDEASMRWRPYGTTALYDALARVAEVAKESQRSRRAVVLVSDGIDNASTVASDQARALLQGAGLPVFVLDVAARFERAGVPARLDSDLVEQVEGSRAPAFSLAELAMATGGRYLEVADHVAMQSAADQVFRDLRQQYLLGFTTDSAEPAGWHRIEVAVRADKKSAPQRLRHRTRYFGSPPAGWSASAAVPAGDAATLVERRRLRGPDRQRAAPKTSSSE